MPETLRVSELIQALSRFSPHAKVYCNERGRYDDRRIITGVDGLLISGDKNIGNIALVEYSNV